MLLDVLKKSGTYKTHTHALQQLNVGMTNGSGLEDLQGVREAINNEEELKKSYAEAAKNQEREVGVPQYYFYKHGQLVHTLSGESAFAFFICR